MAKHQKADLSARDVSR